MQLIILAIIQACGAKYCIQGELLDETNVDDVVVALVNLAAQVSFVVVLLLCLFHVNALKQEFVVKYRGLCDFHFYVFSLNLCELGSN